MKKVLVIIALFSTIYGYSQEIETIKSTASRWLLGYYRLRLDEIKPISNDVTREFLVIAQASIEEADIPDSLIMAWNQATVDIKEDSIRVFEDQASVPFQIWFPGITEYENRIRKLNMQKVKQKWLVNYGFLDALNESNQIQEMENEHVDD